MPWSEKLPADCYSKRRKYAALNLTGSGGFDSYSYEVTIDGKVVGGFTEVSAPDVSSGPIEYREGNYAVNAVGKQPGRIKYEALRSSGE